MIYFRDKDLSWISMPSSMSQFNKKIYNMITIRIV